MVGLFWGACNLLGLFIYSLVNVGFVSGVTWFGVVGLVLGYYALCLLLVVD